MNTRREVEALDEALLYLNEGKILNKIKGTINNIINKNIKAKSNFLTKKSTKEIDRAKSMMNIKCSIRDISSKNDFDKLYDKEAYCAEGYNIPEECLYSACDNLAKSWDFKSSSDINFVCYSCTGKSMNSIYKLTNDNAYPDNIHLFFIDWQLLPKYFDPAKHKNTGIIMFRYFSDVVDNNARREINKGNKYYQNYHSIYGDKWFRDTCNPPESWEWKD